MDMSIDVTPMPMPAPTQPIPPKSSTVKTDKPRPHVCTTCTRSFARLEHLKRHERSHTKEKPFKCDVCERCFARRDLLLRHRQKLHASFPESPRVRQTKQRKSTKDKKSQATSQAQKAAVVTNALTSGANAPSGLSIALPTDPLQGSAVATASPTSSGGGSPPRSANPLKRIQKQSNRPRTMSFSASSSTSYSTQKDIEAWNNNSQWHPSAPPQVGFSTPQIMPAGFSDSESNPFEDFFQASDPLFINPQLLGQGHSPEGQLRQFQSQMHEFDQQLANRDFLSLDNDDFSWLGGGGANGATNGQDKNSPQAILNSSSSALDDPLALTNNTNTNNNGHRHSTSTSSIMSPPTVHSGGSEGGDTNPTTVSPDMTDVFGLNFDKVAGGDESNGSNTDMWKFQSQSQLPNNTITNNFNQTSLTQQQQQQQQVSHIITPQLRQHVLNTLNTPTNQFSTNPQPHLPSTLDLQRYINSYLDNFGKHMPFLHDTLEFTTENMPLALGMAAIGALYGFEHANSASIFEISRCCIHVYLESRRDRKENEHAHTPLWLVQALVLGVIYGLFSNEPMVNDIAVAQANAVVSLAKSAGLHLHPFQFVTVPDAHHSTVEDKWQFFIKVQSRIRTMHVVHTLSCLLASSYDVSTTLKNEDIKCGTPCDESLWTAQTSTSWWETMRQKQLDGTFKDAVEGHDFNQMLDKLMSGQPLVDMGVPQFTLLSLIYAQHLNIHEQKLQHDHQQQYPSLYNREESWLNQKKNQLDNGIIAWETTWSLSPLSSLTPSQQYGPLMSDSIPLSLLAHVRTYLDLRKVKERFWKRDFEQMGRELDNLQVPVLDGEKPFNALFEAASYAADSISLWAKHSTATWTLESSVSQTFIHTILSLFDCGLVVSEFLHRLEQRPSEQWTSEEEMLVTRIRKIFYRVVEVVGQETEDGNILDIGNTSKPTSVLSLQVVSKILCKSYIWPFALVMGKALQARADQINNINIQSL